MILPFSKPNISIVFVIKNEADTIIRSLGQALKLSNNVIVMDCGSEDGTLELIKDLPIMLIQQEWIGYSENKNLANSFAKNDWILSLDGDEILTDDLINEIQQIEFNPKNIYALLIAPNYAGYWVKHSGWYPKYYKRLFLKQEHNWDDRQVHEKLTNLGGKNTVRLKSEVEHYSIKSKEHHMQKINRYARLQANMWVENGKKPSILKKMIGGWGRFVRTYILKLGFLDGKIGWQIAVNEAKLIQLQLAYFKEFSDQVKP
jgi:glycosyltransferase involved in cell wall biosynthesis